jgi:hypothetical protein
MIISHNQGSSNRIKLLRFSKVTAYFFLKTETNRRAIRIIT